ncbi:hypothetical protein PI125_g6815, partial [Phytophthora idaei]
EVLLSNVLVGHEREADVNEALKHSFITPVRDTEQGLQTARWFEVSSW